MAVFELYNPDGSLHLDLSRSTSKFLNQQLVSLAAGQVVVPGPSNTRPWYQLWPLVDNPYFVFTFPTVTVNLGARTISWNARSSGANCLLVYGVY